MGRTKWKLLIIYCSTSEPSYFIKRMSGNVNNTVEKCLF